MKILLSKPGLDGHDVGVKVLAHALKEAGFEVFYTGLRKSVETILDIAQKYKVDFIGLSILSGTHKIICEKMRNSLAEKGMDTPWVVGGNIPAKDVDALMKLGPNRVFPTGTQLQEVIDYFKSLNENP